jgi:hypothetical protein
MITFGKLGRYGRLGNQMFQIASTIGIAKANGYDFAFPKWINHDALDRFGSKEDINVSNWFRNWDFIKRIDEASLPEYHINWGWQGLSHPDGYSYVGHMQSEKYFLHCSDYIREVFTFCETMHKVNMTAIHVRCGDYGSDYHPICTKDYYAEAIREVRGPYMVFSDDPQKSHSILYGLVPTDTYFHSGNTFEALYWMVACSRHIIANSTFSWWGAWLSESEKVIAPKIWFGPSASNLETRDIYCDGWLVI